MPDFETCVIIGAAIVIVTLIILNVALTKPRDGF